MGIPKIIETDRLILRAIKERDSEALFEIWSHPEVIKFMNISAMETIEDARSMILILEALTEKKAGFRWTIMLKDSSRIIGTCGFNYLDEYNKRTEIGYELAREQWGKGLMREALLWILQIITEEMGYNRIEAKVMPENKNSIRLLEKLGFYFEGILRQHEYTKDIYQDVAMYSKLKEEGLY
ncbi:GNAT family N-acetyltransferase [Metabacillus sp. RGM 3146]|uniref:GNAT family N-acetyltransferase n=1 Tax=Metabacillus sp. RGM 3146 TaxID=3401092 RepID=UPI003B9CA567